MRPAVLRSVQGSVLVLAAVVVAWAVHADLRRYDRLDARIEAALPDDDAAGLGRAASPTSDAPPAGTIPVTLRDGPSADRLVVDVAGVQVEVPRAAGDAQDRALARVADAIKSRAAGRDGVGAALAVEARDALTVHMRLIAALADAGIRDLTFTTTSSPPPR